jgi:hypothetical protein
VSFFQLLKHTVYRWKLHEEGWNSQPLEMLPQQRHVARRVAAIAANLLQKQGWLYSMDYGPGRGNRHFKTSTADCAAVVVHSAGQPSAGWLVPDLRCEYTLLSHPR